MHMMMRNPAQMLFLFTTAILAYLVLPPFFSYCTPAWSPTGDCKLARLRFSISSTSSILSATLRHC